MNKFMKAAAAIMLMAAVVMTAGCNKENGGNGGSDPTTEGIYLGIIGFNNTIIPKDISLLNSSTEDKFISFINGLIANDKTALYYADYTGLKTMKAYSQPPKLKTVALVTFTDGLDNHSLNNSTTNPMNYSSKSEYSTAVHNMILNEPIHGKNVIAYAIGLEGDDSNANPTEFLNNLNNLADSPSKVCLASDMNVVKQQFRQIAEDLYSTSTTVNIKLEVPGGYDDNTPIRFTFDIDASGNPLNSNRYIAATYKRTSNSRILDNITYHGFAQGVSHLEAFESQDGFRFPFTDLKDQSGNPVQQSILNKLILWNKSGNVWNRESEVSPESSVSTEEEKSSALIMLVLDCTTSLNSDFSRMQEAAKEFVHTLTSSNH